MKNQVKVYSSREHLLFPLLPSPTPSLKDGIQGVVLSWCNQSTADLLVSYFTLRVYYCLSIVEPPPAPEWKRIVSWDRKDSLTLWLSDSGLPSGQACPRDNASLPRFCRSLEVPAPAMVSSAMSICIGCSFCLEIRPFSLFAQIPKDP